jgi:predicted short-subunit dehydrogenase-like oxidoreductase (DUF2520 family)
MVISFIGAGNVAWHLAQAFEAAGHIISEIFSRDPQNARLLAMQLYDCHIQPDLNLAESEAELIVLAVPEQALEAVLERVVFPARAMVVNTSGSKSLQKLRQLTEVYSDVPVRVGVLYPLQTFTKVDEIDYSSLPFCIEAADEEMEDTLVALAQTVSNVVYRMDSEERKILHIAATIANNFTNHLYGIAHDLLDIHNIDFDILMPLLEQTVKKSLSIGDPSKGQTGLAVRGDWETIGQHLTILQEVNPEWANLYRHLSESIRDKHYYT